MENHLLLDFPFAKQEGEQVTHTHTQIHKQTKQKERKDQELVRLNMAARDTVTRRAKSGDITSCPPWRGRGKDVGEAGGGGGKTEEAVAEDVGSELQDDSRPAGRGRGGGGRRGCEPDVCETHSRSL